MNVSRRKTETLTIRLTPGTRAMLDEAQQIIPYFPTITTILERGLLLAIRELYEMSAVVPNSDRLRSDLETSKIAHQKRAAAKAMGA